MLQSAKEAESEWIDNKMRVKSTLTSEDPGKKEHEELKNRIERLAESVKIANLQPQFQKRKKSSVSTPKSPRSPRVETSRDTTSITTSNSPGPGITSAGPFHGNQRALQCYRFGGCGHVQRECPTQENLDWRGLQRADPTPEETPCLESA